MVTYPRELQSQQPSLLCDGAGTRAASVGANASRSCVSAMSAMCAAMEKRRSRGGELQEDKQQQELWCVCERASVATNEAVENGCRE